MDQEKERKGLGRKYLLTDLMDYNYMNNDRSRMKRNFFSDDTLMYYRLHYE